MEKRFVNLRMVLVGAFLIMSLIGIATRAVYLQVVRGPWLSQKATDQFEKTYTAAGKRGTIYDRNLNEMAISIDVTSIGAFPRKVNDAAASAKALAKVLDLSPRDLKRKLTSKKSFVWIKRQASPRETDAVRNLTLEGIGFVPEHNRFYPQKNLAAQTIGFTGIDGEGLEGLEFFYDQQLKGDPTEFTMYTDAMGNGFRAEQQKITENKGHNLILTIDRNVQYIAETVLEETVSTYSARSGMAVVMVPQTGAILALAHYPFFNPNVFTDFDRERWRDRTITDEFEPGSTMKVFLSSAAIESGRVTPNTIFFCENGAYRIGRNVVHDVSSHGWLSLAQIVKYSSNIGAVKVSEMIGSRRVYDTLRQFGFGQKTDVDCPGETPGSLAYFTQWSNMDAGAIAFGHGLSVSALQLATAVSAIANDGVLMKPYLVQAVTDKNGTVLMNFTPQKIRQAVRPETARTVVRMMTAVTERDGTGANAALEGYTVAGKTGTAHKIGEDGTYSETKYMASFVGFTPAERPSIVVVVIIDEPQQKYYGGIVAAPAFRKIAHETLLYLNVLPEKDKGRVTASRMAEALG
jgi:cell division protein FtsI (penicillin-binding protein 3)